MSETQLPKEQQIRLLQEGIANVSRAQPNDVKIRLIAVIFWHLTAFFMSLSLEKLKKMVPIYLAPLLHEKLPFKIFGSPSHLDKVNLDQSVPALILNLWKFQISAATLDYADVENSRKQLNIDFAFISNFGDNNELVPWGLRTTSIREFTRLLELISVGELTLPEGMSDCLILSGTNHALIRGGKAQQFRENDYDDKGVFKHSESELALPVIQFVGLAVIE